MAGATVSATGGEGNRGRAIHGPACPRYDATMPALLWYPAVVVAYLVGAIPFGLLLGRARGVDIRRVGSGNIGATNLGRALGRKWGLICFLLDVAKGFLPVFIAGWLFGWLGHERLPASAVGQWLGIAMAAMLGHIFPVYLKLRGGKGVATGFGVMLGLWPMLTLPALAALGTWLLFAGALRYVSLASVVAACLLPGYFLLAAAVRDWPLDRFWPFVLVTGVMALLVTARHMGNLRRIVAGSESRLGVSAGGA